MLWGKLVEVRIHFGHYERRDNALVNKLLDTEMVKSCYTALIVLLVFVTNKYLNALRKYLHLVFRN